MNAPEPLISAGHRRRDLFAISHRERLCHPRRAQMAGLAAVLLALLGDMASGRHVALADPAQTQDSPTSEDHPWNLGVSTERKARARELLALGNELLLHDKYAEALRRYEEAVTVWDHPAIRANMVVCFIHLGRTLEAHENARLALRYGAAPYIKREVYEETLSYAKLLDSQVVKLEVRCDHAGARVTLDGQPLMTCPGTRERPLLGGTHQIVARKRGYLTLTSDLMLQPGASRRFDVRMVSLVDAARTERRWATWKPWAVVASGGALLVVGGLLQVKAGRDANRSGALLERECGDPGCDPERVPQSVKRFESRAVLESQVAASAAIVGTAVAITGLVSLYLNRPRMILPDESGFDAHLSPVVTTSGAGLVMEGRF